MSWLRVSLDLRLVGLFVRWVAARVVSAGRWGESSVGRRLRTAALPLAVATFVILGGTYVGVWDPADIRGSDTVTMDDCLKDAAAGLRRSLPRDVSRFVFEDKLVAAARPMCARWISHPQSGSLTEETGPRFVRRLIREDASFYAPLCRLVVDAEHAAEAEVLKFMTKRDRTRYRTDLCRLAPSYMRDDLSLDYRALVAAHPGLYVPHCASGIQYELTRDPGLRPLFDARERRVVARQTCLQAFRQGVIKPDRRRGFRDPKVDDAAFAAILRRTARQFGAT
jgi:hypothetical protein